MSKILLTGGTETIPLAKKLKERHDFLGLYPQVAKNLQDLDIKAVPTSDFMDGNIQMESQREAARIVAGVVNNPFAVNGIHPNVNEFALAYLPALTYPHLVHLASLVMALDNARPDIAVVHNDVEPLTRVVAMWCKARSKPCVHVPHSVYIDWEKGPIGSDVHDLITASHLCVAGPYQAHWYVKRGAKPDSVFLTGLPQYDKWAMMRPEKEWSQGVLKLDPMKPTVVYASSWGQHTTLHGSHNDVETTYLAFLEAAKEIQTFANIVIKTHPRAQNFDWHVQEVKKSGVKALITPHHLEVILQAADCMIAYGPSNVLFETALMGVTPVCVGGFTEEKAVMTIQSDNFVASVREVLSPEYQDYWRKERDQFLGKYIGNADGHATDRVAKIVEGLLNELAA